MLATQAPPATALIRPARRDSPRPAGTIRSASGPRPNTTWPPAGIAMTAPAGLVTCASAVVIAGVESSVMVVLSASRVLARRPRDTDAVTRSLGAAGCARIHEFGDGQRPPAPVDCRVNQGEAPAPGLGHVRQRACGAESQARHARGGGDLQVSRSRPRPGPGRGDQATCTDRLARP